MEILVTAGGTREDIDPVRGITNYSTGRLGCLIAEKFIQGGAVVTYICSETAARPKDGRIITIRNTAQLLEKLEEVLHTRKYGAVIHTMAVSDYAPYKTAAEKIASSSPYLVVVLKKQPKVIRRVKEIQPDTLLVGFKLLSGAGEKELIKGANKLMDESRADYVLANALEDIHGDVHKGLLLNKNGIVGRGNSKEEIAEIIWRLIDENNNIGHYGQHRGL